ncbi:MAG: group I intron-associated PD-(D/E)XK endonuclease [Candidatus Omnitrophota bacterium]
MHHTKFKADIGVAKVIADLVDKGYVPCIPLSEHQPYDLVVVLDSGEIVKLQVKYATLQRNGTIEVKFKTSWADRHGTHMRRYNEREFDYYAIFCPEKEKIVYIPNTKDCPKVIRFDKARNNQGLHVKWANDYLVIKRESSETIRHTPVMVKT